MANQVSAAIVQIGSKPPFVDSIAISFPTDNILIEAVEDSSIANSCIIFNDLKYFASETQSDLVTAANAGGGGGSSYLSKTYAELVALISGSGLSIGQQYLISDFATKHYIVDGGGTQYLDSIITGDLEPLIVTATAVNKLDAVAKSTVYPQDIIHVDFDEDNWLDDLSFADLSGTPTIVTGWKGTIYFRHDTLLDNYTGFDFRNCKFRRWKTDVADWDELTAYVAGDLSKYSGYIYKALQASTGETPAANSNYWIQLVLLSVTDYLNNQPVIANNIPSGSDFSDFKTFAEGSGSAVYDICCRGNHFKGFRDEYTYFEDVATILSNNVFFLTDEDYYSVYSNEIGFVSNGNTVTGFFYRNTIGNNFGNNMISENFDSNTIECSFKNNVLGKNFNNNTIADTFSSNFIGNSFIDNNMGSGSSNMIGGGFRGNTVGNDFLSNKVASGFKNNQVLSGLNLSGGISGIDFTSATHVYQEYDCTLFKREDLTRKLSYYDNSDVEQIVNANA